MKNYAVYLDTKTGRSQVSFEAETVKITEGAFEFHVGDVTVAMFSRETAFGFVEERGGGAWAEEPPEMGATA